MRFSSFALWVVAVFCLAGFSKRPVLTSTDAYRVYDIEVRGKRCLQSETAYIGERRG
jgi:hypothetical protein